MIDMEIQQKLDVLELAELLGNVSEAAKISGVSRDTIYRHRKLVREGGIAALKKQVNPDHCHQNRTDESIANTVIEFSLDNPHLGQVQVANHPGSQYKIELSHLACVMSGYGRTCKPLGFDCRKRLHCQPCYNRNKRSQTRKRT